MDYCRSASAKYRLLMSVGGGDIGAHRMMEPEDDRRIERMFKSGNTITEIAERMGTTYGTPRNRLLRMGYTKEDLKKR
jgi:DNA invertase Pin-like site-specific DNA recombinase